MIKKYTKKDLKNWIQVGNTKDGKSYMFSNGLSFIAVEVNLVESIRKDSYDLGVEVGKKIAQGNYK
jgi:hypothetical protein